MCLETKNRVHRDISDTNVLLREPEPDSDAKQRIREEFRDQLGLSQIESMRKTFKCREGLLIDYGHAAELLSSQEGPGREGNEDASEVRAVSLLDPMCDCHLLGNIAGYASFHRGGVAPVWCPSPCCP